MDRWFVYLIALFSALLRWGGWNRTAIAFLGIGVLFALARYILKKYVCCEAVPMPAVASAPEGSNHSSWQWAMWGLWLLFAATLLGFMNHRWMIPSFQHWPLPESNFLLFALFAGLVFVIRSSRFTTMEFPDFSPKTAGWFLGIILALAAWARLDFSTSVIGPYWFDEAVEPETTLRIFELGDYKCAFEGQYMHGINPMHQWLLMLIWFVKPTLTVLMSERVVGTLAFVATLWLVYLAGRDAVSRRFGIFACALGLVSKPLFMKTLACHHCNAISLVAALAIWRFFAFMRKPDSANFFWWGVATGFGLYAYTPYRLVFPYFIAASLAWFCFENREEKPFSKGSFWLAGSTLAVFSAYILYEDLLFAKDNIVSRVMDVSDSLLPCVLLILFAVLFARKSSSAFTAEGSKKLVYWSVGVWVCIFVTFPLMTNSFLQFLLKDQANHALSFHPLETLNFLFNKPMMDGEQADLSLPNDCLLGYTEVMFVVLGLALVLARPRFVGLFLVGAALAGMAPHIMTAQPDSLRLMFAMPPILLLAAYGIEEFYLTLAGAWQGRGRKFAGVVLLAVAVATGYATYQRVVVEWAGNFVCRDSFLRARVLEAQAQGARVYLDPALDSATHYTLYEGHPVFKLRDQNRVFDRSGVTVPNLVVFLERQNKSLKDRIERDFPGINWEVLYSVNHGNRSEHVCRGMITADQLRENLAKNQKKGKRKRTLAPKIFELVSLEKPAWERDYVIVREQTYRLAYIQERDCVVDPKQAPPHRLDMEAAWYNRPLRVRKDGDFELITKTGQETTIVQINGKEVLGCRQHLTGRFRDLRQDIEKKASVHLKKGDYKLSIILYSEFSQGFPTLTIRRKEKNCTPVDLWGWGLDPVADAAYPGI